jgi:coenzyme F420-0:L-glutamate ligase/coenzyme F420-1:gamma-L-glutamate ligase
VVLLPVDPDASARALRSALRRRLGVDVAVIVTDTMGRPWRLGLMDLAIGAAGIDPLRDHRGEVDAYGNELHITQMALIDELASAAELVKGKVDQVPIAVVRGMFSRPPAEDGPGATALVRESRHDLFALGTAEARAAGLRQAAELGAPAHHLADEAPDVSLVRLAVAGLSDAVAPDTLLTHVTDPLVRDKLVATVTADLRGGQPELILISGEDPVVLGMDVHRVRCALAAAELISGWRAVTAADLADAGAKAPPSGPAASGATVSLVLVWTGRPTLGESIDEFL